MSSPSTAAAPGHFQGDRPARSAAPTSRDGGRSRTRPLVSVAVTQSFLILAHCFMYLTWIAFWPIPSPAGRLWLGLATALSAFSFVPAAALSFRFSSAPLRACYKLSVIWLGFLNFLFLAAIASWPVLLVVWLAGADSAAARMAINGALSALALAAGLYGIVNARWVRTRRIPVLLPNLPPAWRGRRAVLLTDLHLGNVNGAGFCRRMARLTNRLQPDVVFLAGDLFDGVKTDADCLLAPLRELKPALGVYFCTGNHEEFGDPRQYIKPIERAGIRVLNNERVTVEGVHIAGVSYHDASEPIKLRALLEGMSLNGGCPSILLHHVPSGLPIVEYAGVSLQLSGHTHGGQIFPYNWITRRIFGKFTYGLNRFGGLQVYTSYGAGTWGPPMRVGTHPEIVALEFE